MKKLILASVAAMSLTACCQNTATDQAQQTATVSKSDAVIETIMSRRSIRKYKPQPVGRDTVETIIKCGINAPSAMNRQDWELRVVDDQAYLDSLTAIYKAHNEKAAADTTMRNLFRNAPTVIFVAKKNGDTDAALAIENMALAAWSMGIGSCIQGGPVRFIKDAEEAKPYLDKLEFSEGYELSLVLGIGYPDETPEAKPRDESKVKFLDFK